MAQKLPGTVMRKRKRHRGAEKGREGEMQKGKEKMFARKE